MKRRAISSLFLALAFMCVGSNAFTQSTSQDFPTPIASNEISGTIKARDVGDARLTTYFYTFDGSQGDIFINILTKNFSGDFDIFAMPGLRSLTKIVVYPDVADNETGRVIYLRKPETLLLRVQGRPPGDEAATFRIKFAGSFVASRAEPVAEPELPAVKAASEAGIRVNSVGTILEIPKPIPAPPETIAKVEEPVEEKPVETKSVETQADDDTAKQEVDSAESEKKLEVVVSDNLPSVKETEPAKVPIRRRGRTRRPPPAPKADPARKTDEIIEPAEEIAKSKKTPLPDPLASVRLVILFKDGKLIERPINEVLRFSVNNGVLTVINKNGSIGRYPLVEVTKVTIE